MSAIKKLAGQTAIYGLSSIIGRLLGYLLVPIYTRVLIPEEYGAVTELYSYIAILLVILTYGMETAFFRFTESETNKDKVFSTSFLSILMTSSVFLVTILLFKGNIAELIMYPDKSRYILFLGLLLVFDALSTIPFARLRSQNRPIKFASFKLFGIFVNIGLNLFLLLALPRFFPGWKYSNVSEYGVDYILLSNVISSGLMFFVFIPDLLKIKWDYDRILIRKILKYALPLLIFGLAGVLDEVFGRVLLKYLLPEDIAMTQLGIYGACYKVSIIMTIFIQAYRYAAEPFFFAYEKQNDSKMMYANLMHYFIIITALIFLVTMLYMNVVIYFVGEKYRIGATVIPILLYANLFLGVFYNLSIWYKLTNKTKYGAYISIIGAVLTIALNFVLIPLYGYVGSAWVTFTCYGTMMIISYVIGQKHYPVPYKITKALVILSVTAIIYFANLYIKFENIYLSLMVSTLFLVLFFVFLAFYEKEMLLRVKSMIRRK